MSNKSLINNLFKLVFSSIKHQLALIFFLIVVSLFGLFFSDSFLQLRDLVLKLIPDTSENYILEIFSYKKAIIHLLLYLILIGWLPRIISVVFILPLNYLPKHISLDNMFNIFGNLISYLNKYIYLPLHSLFIYVLLDTFLVSNQNVFENISYIFEEFRYLSILLILTVPLYIIEIINILVVNTDEIN